MRESKRMECQLVERGYTLNETRVPHRADRPKQRKTPCNATTTGISPQKKKPSACHAEQNLREKKKKKKKKNKDEEEKQP